MSISVKNAIIQHQPNQTSTMFKPTEVKAKAEYLEDANCRFRTFLKIHAEGDELDAQFLALHKELFANYDCCKCNNCCRAFDISLDGDEAKRIAAFLGMTESDFAAKYLTNADPEDDKPSKFATKPCPFLGGDGRCAIQECKPDVCTGFPYTDKPNRLSSMWGVIDNTAICPVVFEILEEIKGIYGFRNRVPTAARRRRNFRR
jgi:Fe-S-cluster containining protein